MKVEEKEKGVMKRKKKRTQALSPIEDPSSSKKKQKKKKKTKETGDRRELSMESTTVLPGGGKPRDGEWVVDGSEMVGKRFAVAENVDSEVRARRTLQRLLAPVGARLFYASYFERKALCVRERGRYWGELMCPEDVFEVLESTRHVAGEDADVSRFDGSKRVDVLPPTEVVAAEWARDQFRKGATVRLRCPQASVDAVHAMCLALEDEFGADVSANAYLTPASEQGFAPHFDDVDVFVLQLHGRKRWRVYTPNFDRLKLPRHPSLDFDPASLVDGRSEKKRDYGLDYSLDAVCLEPGDLLYLPRGFVHQAKTEGPDPSLHLTVSTHRLNSWTDFFERCLERGLAKASESSLPMRASLPRDYFHFMGLQHHQPAQDQDIAPDGAPPGKHVPPADDGDSLADDASLADAAAAAPSSPADDGDSLADVAAAHYDADIENGGRAQAERRAAFRAQAKRRLRDILDACLDDAVLDAAADDVALRFVADRQPPVRSSPNPDGISHTTKLRPVARRAARLVLDDDQDKALLYHALDNARAHRQAPVACLEFDINDAPAIETLLNAHVANPVQVCDLPHATLDDKLDLASALYQEGLLVAERSDRQIRRPSSGDNGTSAIHSSDDDDDGDGDE